MSKSAGIHFGSSDPQPKTATEKLVQPQKVVVRPEFESFTQLLAQKMSERSSIQPCSESEKPQISEEVARSVAQNRRKF